VIDKVDPRAGRTAPARFDHGQDDTVLADEQCLDAAVAAIADPALQTAFQRRHFGPGAVADALHPTADRHEAVHVQANSPSLRWPAPSGRVGNHSCNEAM